MHFNHSLNLLQQSLEAVSSIILLALNSEEAKGRKQGDGDGGFRSTFVLGNFRCRTREHTEARLSRTEHLKPVEFLEE
jgi:hypothetical protein